MSARPARGAARRSPVRATSRGRQRRVDAERRGGGRGAAHAATTRKRFASPAAAWPARPRTGSELVAARAEIALGRYRGRAPAARAAAAASPDDLPVRDALMRLYEEVGDRAALAPLIDASYADWNGGQRQSNAGRRPAGHRDRRPPRRQLEGRQRGAARRRPRRPARRAPTSTGDCCCWRSTTRRRRRRPSGQVLKVDPEDPDAHVGLAARGRRRRYDAASARVEIARALAVNPRHAGALALRAELALDGEDFEAARADVAVIRRLNPRRPGRGARRRGRGAAARRRRRLRAHARRRLASHAHDGELFAFVAEALERQRRYDEARAVAAEGVAADPRTPVPLGARDDVAAARRRGGGRRDLAPRLEDRSVRRAHVQPAQPLREGHPRATTRRCRRRTCASASRRRGPPSRPSWRRISRRHTRATSPATASSRRGR